MIRRSNAVLTLTVAALASVPLAVVAQQQPPSVQPKSTEQPAGPVQPNPGTPGASTSPRATTEGTQGAARLPGSDELANAIHSDDLIGSTVRNAANENIGRVDALLLSPEGKVVGVVVDVGGFLGVGARQVVVPMQQLSMIDDENVRMQAATKEQLEKAPVYEKKTPGGG